MLEMVGKLPEASMENPSKGKASAIDFPLIHFSSLVIRRHARFVSVGELNLVEISHRRERKLQLSKR
jgi:hypothetical protein